MTSGGSPYSRFKRALLTGNVALVHAAAAELPAVDLADALAICLLMSARDDERYERAAVRWLARLALERPGVGLGDLRDGLVAFEAMPYNPAAARQTLAGLCERLHLTGAMKVLSGAPARRR
jgi:hypothetical protein